MNQIHFLHAPHVEDPPDAMLDPRLLRSFVGIIDAQSFTAAADRLSMTQSTISQQLARLEEQVGSALVDRTARPIVATAAGERLLAYARRILAPAGGAGGAGRSGRHRAAAHRRARGPGQRGDGRDLP